MHLPIEAILLSFAFFACWASLRAFNFAIRFSRAGFAGHGTLTCKIMIYINISVTNTFIWACKTLDMLDTD